jgi:outer membrane protein assembly factor BamB
LENTKTTIATIALILTLTFAATLVSLPTAKAHTPPLDIPTYAYIFVAPNPVGVGQNVFVVFWIDKLPPTAQGGWGDRWHDFKVEVTKPDGSKQDLGTFTSDPVGGGYTMYMPDTVGTYYFQFSFPGQTLAGENLFPGQTAGIESIGDYYEASTSEKVPLTVQQDLIPEPPTYPLPTEYWTRPIEGQNTDWWTIASNWLGSPQIKWKFQPDGIAPNSAHIMWTKPLQVGGVVGGSYTSVPGMTFYGGLAYEGKFTNPIIMNGKLYYDTPLSNDANDGPFICVDLLTGETLWENPDISPSFGQLYDYQTPNQHGVIPNGYLWSTNFGDAYDPITGDWLFSLTDVPRGTEVYGPNGEIVRYVLNYAGRWLALWNNTAVPELWGGETGSSAWQWRPLGKTANASTAYQWKVTIPDLPGLGTPAILAVIPGDLVFGTSTSGRWDFEQYPYTLWAISLKPDSRGELLWIKNYTAPPGIIMLHGLADSETHIYALREKETMRWWGISMDDGSVLWGPTPSENPLDFYSKMGVNEAMVAYGRLYTSSYGGVARCYDLKNGALLWNYSEPTGLATAWPNWPLSMGAIADGKVYLFSTEHSPDAPPYKGSSIRCVDAFNGEELWTMMGWGSGGHAARAAFAVADGYLLYLNCYDMQIYCLGKGPSATTVTASPSVVNDGSSVIIQGRVTDESAGTKQTEQAGRFPNGVPAIADADMSEWMEYVYMQKPIPADATGVPVTLDAIDPNGNFVHIGRVTSDMSGFYSYKWKPENEGKYTIIATFEGSDSYYCSYAETAIGVDPAPAPAQPIEPEEPTEAPLITTEVAIIAAVAVAVVIGIVTYWALRKRQ